MKYTRRSVRAKNKTRKNKKRMMKRGGAKNEINSAIFKETLKDKIEELKSGIIFTRETQYGFKKERDSCRKEVKQLKEENKILEKEKEDLEIKISKLKEELKLKNKSKMMKRGGAVISKRSPLLPTETNKELQDKIDSLDNKKNNLIKKRDHIRKYRDKCYHELNKLKEENKMLEINNKKLKREIRNLEDELQENRAVETNNLSARNSSISNPNSNYSNYSNYSNSNKEVIPFSGMTPDQMQEMEKKIKEMIHNAWIKSNMRRN